MPPILTVNRYYNQFSFLLKKMNLFCYFMRIRVFCLNVSLCTTWVKAGACGDQERASGCPGAAKWVLGTEPKSLAEQPVLCQDPKKPGTNLIQDLWLLPSLFTPPRPWAWPPLPPVSEFSINCNVCWFFGSSLGPPPPPPPPRAGSVRTLPDTSG